MENKINIAELLKDCPKGMELDCTMFDDVTFINVEEKDKPICIRTGDIYRYLTKFGTYTFDENAKCVIFPKGKITWDGFVPPCKFKDGDIVISDMGDIHLLRTKDSSCCAYRKGKRILPEFDSTLTTNVTIVRLATEEEKQELFNVIKANGYRWNAETKTLEKLIVPKFKVGDRIKHKEKTRWVCTIARVEDRYYVDGHPMCFTLPFGKQDDYELVPNKFDITTLVPFESRVLVRDSNKKWRPAVYGFCNKFETRCAFYAVGGCVFEECIPYKNNEHLLGTTNDCDDFYKTW